MAEGPFVSELDPVQIVATTLPELEDLLGGLDDATEHGTVVARVAGVSLVRALTVLGIDRCVSRRFTLVVTGYRPPTRAWRGTLGSLPALRAVAVDWPTTFPGEVSVSVTLSDAVDLSTVAAAVVRLLMPAAGTAHYGSQRVAVAACSPTSVLGLLPTPWASRPRTEPDPDLLVGNDIVLAGATTDLGSVEHSSAVVVGSDGRLGDDRVVIDLRRYNPIGRNPKINGEFVSRAAALTWADDRWNLGIDGKHVRSFDPRANVPDEVIFALRPCTTIDLSGLEVVELKPVVLAARLAEIAATGTVLVGGEHLVPHMDGLSGSLTAGLARVAAPTSGLANLLVSVEQSRAAMRDHGGAVRFARLLGGGAVGAGLPHVTAMLVTNRPHLVGEAVSRMAAQTYPNLDVVVVMHGVAVPDRPRQDERWLDVVSDVVEIGPDVPFGTALAIATTRAQGGLVLKIDDDDLYGPEFVWDLVLARLMSGAQVVGKQPEHTFLEQLDVTVRRGFVADSYGEQVAGGTMMMSVDDIISVGGWRGVHRAVDRALMQRIICEGGIVYVDRGVGFIYVRHGRGHTWEAGSERFLRNVVEQWDGVHLRALG